MRSSWYPEPDSNRHDLATEGFSYHFGFRRRRISRSTFVVWSTPSPWCDVPHVRCPPSALYAFPSDNLSDKLGSASTRPNGGHWSGPSPTLTGFTSGVSPRGLNYSSPLCLPIPPPGQYGFLRSDDVTCCSAPSLRRACARRIESFSQMVCATSAFCGIARSTREEVASRGRPCPTWRGSARGVIDAPICLRRPPHTTIR